MQQPILLGNFSINNYNGKLKVATTGLSYISGIKSAKVHDILANLGTPQKTVVEPSKYKGMSHFLIHTIIKMYLI